MTTYFGSCHCQHVRFRVEAQIDHARVCNCSICRQRGALMFRVREGQLTLLSAWDDLASYQWGRQTAKDYFCPNCGILPFRRPAALTDQERSGGAPDFTGWAINIRCLKDVDLEALPVRQIDGRKL